MSRVELARLLLIVVGVAVAGTVGFAAVLHRERRRRAHWSTRTRAAHPHWSITLAERIGHAAGRLTLRRRKARRPRRRDL